MQEAVIEQRTFATAKGIAVDSYVPEAAVEIDADADAIRRLFVILIDNAVKYTNPGGVIRVTVTATGDLAQAAVTDTGIGTAKEATIEVESELGQGSTFRVNPPLPSSDSAIDSR